MSLKTARASIKKGKYAESVAVATGSVIANRLELFRSLLSDIAKDEANAKSIVDAILKLMNEARSSSTKLEELKTVLFADVSQLERLVNLLETGEDIAAIRDWANALTAEIEVHFARIREVKYQIGFGL